MEIRCVCHGHQVDDETAERCPVCSCPLLLVHYPEGLSWVVEANEPSMWRYSSLLPRVERRVSFGEGLTPLRRLGGVYLKFENKNPTGSYADRASSLIASRLYPRLRGRTVTLDYVEDFTLSTAYYLSTIARVTVEADPRELNPLDAIGLARIGVSIVFRKATRGVKLGYSNPLTIEGLKTIAYEIAEAKPPTRRVYIPAETGLLAIAVAKGFAELREAGLDVDYEVVAVTVETGKPPLLNHSPYPISHVTVDSEETVKALLNLARRGLKVKPLSAAAYAAAASEREGIAIVTSSITWRTLSAKPGSKLAEEIIKTLRELGEATAYTIWKNLKGRYTLRGVYKALASLEAEGKVCSRYTLQGRRRVKLYHTCK